jgi:hypothetical protein
MSNNTILLSIFIFSSIMLLSSCQQDTGDQQSQTETPTGENLYYDCMAGKIVIDAKTTVKDNQRGQWSLSFDGTLHCGSEPINGAEVNVKSILRDTDLTIKTKETGEFTVKLNRLEENPSGKEFIVTLMGTKDTSITKTFKVD